MYGIDNWNDDDVALQVIKAEVKEFAEQFELHQIIPNQDDRNNTITSISNS